MWTEHDDLEPCTSLVETLKGMGGGGEVPQAGGGEVNVE